MKSQPFKAPSNSLMILITVVALGGGFTLGWLFSRVPIETSPTSSGTEIRKPSSGPVPGRGRITPADDILQLSPGTPDRVVAIKVKEGDRVKKDDELIELESHKERKLAYEMAETRLEEAQKQRQAIDRGGHAEVRVAELQAKQLDVAHPQEVRAQERKLDLLQKQQKTAQTNLERLRGLSPGTIPDQDQDQQRLAVEQSETQLAEARIALREMQEKYRLDKALLEAREEAARSKAAQAMSEISLPILEKRVDQAREQMRESILRAPIDGTVLRITTHVGELVGAKPILEMANLKVMEVEAEVHESFYWRVAIGQKATILSKIPISSSEDSSKMTGTVSYKGSIIGQQSLFGLDPRSRRDDRVFQVRIRIDDSEHAAHLIGHQVDINIDSPSQDQK